ncbi:MAG: YkvA family protein [Oceanococcus sp.]
MSTDHDAAKKSLEHARSVLNERFLDQAKEANAQEEVNEKLAGKIDGLKGRSQTMQRLRALSGQATQLWQQRGQLSAKQVLYLTAGLLYFISPVDAVTDLIPIFGYIDDVAVLGWILSQVLPSIDKLKDQAVAVKDSTIDQATDQLVDKGRVALNEVVDQRSEELLEKLELAADDAVRKYVSAVVIGLWGTSTAAAISLALSLLSGGYTKQWMIYVGVTTALILLWNLTVALSFVRQYRQLDQAWQERLPRIIGTRVARWRHIMAVSLPLLAFLGLAIAHVALNSSS